MGNGIDFSRVKARNYRVQWRFIIDCPSNITCKSHYYNYYMGTNSLGKPSRWSRFISQIMATKLSKEESKVALPMIRSTLPVSTKLVDIHPLLFEHNPALTRALFDVAIVFDSSPHDLKAYIVICFGITPDVLKDFLRDRDKEKVA